MKAEMLESNLSVMGNSVTSREAVRASDPGSYLVGTLIWPPLRSLCHGRCSPIPRSVSVGEKDREAREMVPCPQRLAHRKPSPVPLGWEGKQTGHEEQPPREPTPACSKPVP